MVTGFRPGSGLGPPSGWSLNRWRILAAQVAKVWSSEIAWAKLALVICSTLTPERATRSASGQRLRSTNV